MRLGETTSRHPFDLNPAFERLAAFFADRLALARGEARQKIVEARIAFVPPVELLIGALEQIHLAGKLPFVAGGEGDMQ